MAQSYFAEGLAEKRGTFSLFYRHLPERWGYLLAAGLEDVLTFLESFTFDEDEIAYLAGTGLFTPAFLDYLGALRFSGDVRAMAEGTPFFPEEPVIEITGSIVEAQLVETYVLNQIHFQSLIAAKAARCVEAARGARLVDFSLRRTHGADAGLKVARASYLAGFDSTSNVLAGRLYGIPISGTMAHSYIECFEDELEAFRAFARAYPDSCVLLVDTYDTVEGARYAARVAGELAERGSRLRGVRLDSGDMVELSRVVREVLDQAGHGDATIFASGGFDEYELDRVLARGARIDAFGPGSKLGVSADAPYLDMAYKLVAFDDRPVLKLSPGKATWPGEKQVWRVAEGERFAFDVLDLRDHPGPTGAEALLRPVMSSGRRLGGGSLVAAREHAGAQRLRLPSEQRQLDAEPYEVRVGGPLLALRDRLAGEARGRYDL